MNEDWFNVMFYKYGIEDYKLLMAKSKYSIEIVNILFSSSSSINHQELCEKLNIKKNYLSNIIDRLEPFDILYVQKIGKNVYYSLTIKGVEFYRYIHAKAENMPEVVYKGQPELAYK